MPKVAMSFLLSAASSILVMSVVYLFAWADYLSVFKDKNIFGIGLAVGSCLFIALITRLYIGQRVQTHSGMLVWAPLACQMPFIAILSFIYVGNMMSNPLWYDSPGVKRGLFMPLALLFGMALSIYGWIAIRGDNKDI